MSTSDPSSSQATPFTRTNGHAEPAPLPVRVGPATLNRSGDAVTGGIVEITPQDLVTRSLDYGPGTCDQTAVLTVADFVQEINLP